jgi:hypothetical protein
MTQPVIVPARMIAFCTSSAVSVLPVAVGTGAFSTLVIGCPRLVQPSENTITTETQRASWPTIRMLVPPLCRLMIVRRFLIAA